MIKKIRFKFFFQRVKNGPWDSVYNVHAKNFVELKEKLRTEFKIDTRTIHDHVISW